MSANLSWISHEMASNRQIIRSQWQDLRIELAARGGTWLPSRQVMLGVPQVLPCEAFSSWVYRSAISTRIHLRSLRELWNIDAASFWVDCGVVDFDAELVAKSLHNADIAAIKASRWPHHSTLARWRGLCLTTEPLNRRPIYRYCEECFSNDAIPYIRKAWRLAYNYICTEHGTLLRERCTVCDGRLDLSVEGEFARQNRPQRLTLRNCQHCGADMCPSMKKSISKQNLDILMGAQLEIQMLVHNLSQRNPNEDDSNFNSHRISAEFLDRLMLEIRDRRNGPDSRLRYEKIDGLIARYFHNSPSSFHIVHAGINGYKLFGKNAERIQSLFSSHERKFESTLWIPLDKHLPSIPEEQILRANKWLRSGKKDGGY